MNNINNNAKVGLIIIGAGVFLAIFQTFSPNDKGDRLDPYILGLITGGVGIIINLDNNNPNY